MITTILSSLFGNSNALSNAQIESDRDVLLIQLKASVFPLQSNPGDLGLYSSVIREIDSLLSDWQYGIELTWRCYVSGFCWQVSKAKVFISALDFTPCKPVINNARSSSVICMLIIRSALCSSEIDSSTIFLLFLLIPIFTTVCILLIAIIP